jgi:hypothetical protein
VIKVQVGDVFKNNEPFPALYKVIAIEPSNLLKCEVYFDSRMICVSLEHNVISLKMQKLSSLEKELM